MSIDFPKVIERQLDAIRDLQKCLKYSEEQYQIVVTQLNSIKEAINKAYVFKDGVFWKLNQGTGKLTKKQAPLDFKRRYKKRK